MAITGRGGASKEQVNAMLERILNFKFDHGRASLDASDGIAVALCHYFQKGKDGKPAGGNLGPKGKGGSWANFIKNNPDRLK